MNKNIVLGLGGIIVAGIGYGIFKALNKKEGKIEEVKESTKETSSTTEEKDNSFMDKMMAEYEEDCEATKNWDERSRKCREEMATRKSAEDINPFEEKVEESKEFAAINAIREASGKEPLKVSEQFEKFLGKDSDKSVKESLDSIAENIKKDPEFKKKILDILQE